VLVGGIIVEHDIDFLACRNLVLEEVEKADELLVGVVPQAVDKMA